MLSTGRDIPWYLELLRGARQRKLLIYRSGWPCGTPWRLAMSGCWQRVGFVMEVSSSALCHARSRHQSIVGWCGSRCTPSRERVCPTWDKAGLWMAFVDQETEHVVLLWYKSLFVGFEQGIRRRFGGSLARKRTFFATLFDLEAMLSHWRKRTICYHR